MKSKKYLVISVLILVDSFQIFAQNQTPQVSNVIFSQRTDGSFFVDVYYDVNDPESNVMTVTMQVSSDNGVTWNFPCTQISGDVGANITSGTVKHIEWDFGIEHSQSFGDQFRIKIIADDGGVIMGVPCPGIPTITYEGKTYNTVLIGNQCWLKENLDIGTMINSSTWADSMRNNGIIEKYCYDNDIANCTTYGGLYQWNEAMQYSTTPGTQGICPPGWHIPRFSEFETLSTEVGGDGNALKREDQGSGSGQGTNTSGFSALLAGGGWANGFFSNLGSYAFFWSSTEDDGLNAGNLDLYDNVSNIDLRSSGKVNGFSVRCVKD